MLVSLSCSGLSVFSRSSHELYNEYVLKMGVCPEESQLDLGLLPQALGCECHIVVFSADPSVPVTRLEFLLRPGELKIGDVHLLYRPGHYELLYLSPPGAT